jgi:hypothetical protein
MARTFDDDARSVAVRVQASFRAMDFGIGISESQDSMYFCVQKLNGKKVWPFFSAGAL